MINTMRLMTGVEVLDELSSEQQELTKLAENPGILKEYFDLYLPVVISFLIQLILAALVLFIGTRIIKGICKLIQRAFDKSNIDSVAEAFLTHLIKYVLYFILVMVILSGFGNITSSVIAILGSAGLTVGLALQGSLSNFAGGVLIVLIKPFSIGDYIIVSGIGVEGTVSGISLFYTRLKTVDNKVMMVPNGKLSDSCITNVSMLDKRRVDVMVGVDYKSDLAKTKEVLKETAMKQETILSNEPVDVFVSELADSSVNLGVRIWVKQEDYWPTKWKLTEDIKNALDANDISIPFPQLDVHMEK